MQDNGFVFDYAKCVGCHACIAACHFENKTELPLLWRNVNSFNKKKIPLAGYIYLSMACNHCAEAPCINACPANAFKRDPHTGAVIHNQDNCIGCKYCTWACPYSAPKFNEKNGVIEKCSLCNHRLIEGIEPACTNLCPTGALSFSKIELASNDDSFEVLKKNNQPRVNTLRSEVKNHVPFMDISSSGINLNHTELQLESFTKTIEAKYEWPLAIFTLLSALLVGWITSIDLKSSNIEKLILICLGIIGLLFSTFHLGKPLRSYRSIFNIRNSWVSREIVAFGLFGITSLCFLFIDSSIQFKVLSVTSGFILLFCIEMVYSIPKKSYNTPIHSANTVLTALLFSFIFNGYLKLSIVILAVKGLLYLTRIAYDWDFKIRKLVFIPFRFLLGIILPIGFIAFSKYNLIVIVIIVISEMIDRYDYYNNIYVDTPESTLAQKLIRTIRG